MTLRERLRTARELLAHPWTVGSALATTLVGMLGFIDPVWTLLSGTAGTWFAGVAVFTSTINPKLGIIPSGLANKLLIVGGIVYLGVLADKFAEKAVSILDERRDSK